MNAPTPAAALAEPARPDPVQDVQHADRHQRDGVAEHPALVRVALAHASRTATHGLYRRGSDPSARAG